VTARSNGSGCTNAHRNSRCYGGSVRTAEASTGGSSYWSILKTVNRKARMCDRQFRHIHPKLGADANDRGHSTSEIHAPTLFGPLPGADARWPTPRRQLWF
jgi:hypothetical protein